MIRRFAGAGNITYYPLGELVPMHHGVRGDWEDVVHREDTRGRRRVARMVYEVATLQALRDALRCKEIWVVRADRWRDPDQDLPADYPQRHIEHYRTLRKSLDPSRFVDELREQMHDELQALNDTLPDVRVVRDELAERVVASRPGWGRELFGERPEHYKRAEYWDRAVRDVARYRIEHGLGDEMLGLDPG